MNQSSENLNVLIVEDNAGDVRLIKELFFESEQPFKLVEVNRLKSGLAKLQEGVFDVVLLDLGLPDSLGLDTFQRLLPAATGVPVVILTGLDDKEMALKAVQLGAQDYLVKGQFDSHLLMRSIVYAIERQRLSAKIQEQERELERDKARNQFFEIMAHELRNPMSVVKAILTLIRVKAAKGEPISRFTERIQTAEQEMDRISDLLNEVLEAFRADKGHLDFKDEPVNIIDIIERALRPFRASERSHRFILRDALQEAWVIGDNRRLEQVIRNLLENAVKYSPNGGNVTIGVEEGDHAILISIRDEGLGIPDDQLETIFDAFYRASNVAPYDLGGLGLGLFICKTIVENYQGEIWAQTSQKPGSTFVVKLPTNSPENNPHEFTSR